MKILIILGLLLSFTMSSRIRTQARLHQAANVTNTTNTTSAVNSTSSANTTSAANSTMAAHAFADMSSANSTSSVNTTRAVNSTSPANTTSATNSSMAANPTVGMNKTMNISAYISNAFLVDATGKPGKDFLAMKTVDGYYLGCDQFGNLTLKHKNITNDELFIPEISEIDKKIFIKSFYGGYIGYTGNKFNCMSKDKKDVNKFTVDKNIDIKKLKLNVTDKNQVLALIINKTYLGNQKNIVAPIKTLTINAVLLAPHK